MKTDWRSDRVIVTEIADDQRYENTKFYGDNACQTIKDDCEARAKKEIKADIEFQRKLKGQRANQYPRLEYQKLGTI